MHNQAYFILIYVQFREREVGEVENGKIEGERDKRSYKDKMIDKKGGKIKEQEKMQRQN